MFPQTTTKLDSPTATAGRPAPREPSSTSFEFGTAGHTPPISPGATVPAATSPPRIKLTSSSSGIAGLVPPAELFAPQYLSADTTARPEKRRKLSSADADTPPVALPPSPAAQPSTLPTTTTPPAAPAFQVIILGSGGGPSESNVSGYLIRSTSTAWAPSSILAVDAGTHLAGIVSILETTPSPPRHSLPIPHTPFAGCPLPHTTPRANALHITQSLVATFLLTHTHLDHISGFVINTAAFLYPHPKTLAALPPSIDAIKTHIFNDVIWPNLSNENNGAGLVSYLRLPPACHKYTPVATALSVQAHPVSHGHCMKQHAHLGRLSTAGLELPQPRAHWCVLDSAVYFIRDAASGRECMMWGDVEPDSISLDPRNREVWGLAAGKFREGLLGAVFIECSYTGVQEDAALYGHLSPRHLVRELRTLAEAVVAGPAERGVWEEAGLEECEPGYGGEPPGVENGEVEIEVRGALLGLRVVVTHVKDVMIDGRDCVTEVERELRELESKEGLGVEFMMARRGMDVYF